MSRKYIETKLNIHEAYESGYITESEKSDLLYIVESEEDASKKKELKKKIVLVTVGTASVITILIAIRASIKAKKDIEAKEKAELDKEITDIINSLKDHVKYLHSVKEDFSQAIKVLDPKDKSDVDLFNKTFRAFKNDYSHDMGDLKAAGIIISKYGTDAQKKAYESALSECSGIFKSALSDKVKFDASSMKKQ